MLRLVCVRSVYTEAESICGVIILVKRTDGRFLRKFQQKRVDDEAFKKTELRFDLINPISEGGFSSLKSNFGL